MEYEGIRKVEETIYPGDVNAYLETGRWMLLGTAPGRDENNLPYMLYSLGWLGPVDPEFPEDDTSEYPELPKHGEELPWV